MKEYQATIKPIKEFTDTLIGDYAAILRDDLRSRGFDSSTISDDRKLIIAYFTLFSRMVESKKRTVHMPPTLNIDESVREGFELLKGKFQNGGNVNPHLSRLVTKLSKQDKMFFDWGINHFHLGTTMDSDGFISRTGPVAYTVVTPSDIYVVDVAPHGNWSDKQLLETIDRYWPELIQAYRVDGTFEVKFNKDEIKALRNANVNTVITLDNSHSYMSVGGGYATDGSWMPAVRSLLDLTKLFHQLHNELEDNLKLTADEACINQHGTLVDLRLRRDGKDVILYIPNSDYERKILQINPLPK